MLVTPSLAELKRLLVVLCTPDRLLALNNDLAFEDAIDSLFDGLGWLLTDFLVDEAKFRFAKCDVTQISTLIIHILDLLPHRVLRVFFVTHFVISIFLRHLIRVPFELFGVVFAPLNSSFQLLGEIV